MPISDDGGSERGAASKRKRRRVIDAADAEHFWPRTWQELSSGLEVSVVPLC